MVADAGHRLRRPRWAVLGRVVRTQFLATFSAAGLGLIHGPVSGYSALWGGLACAIPTVFFGRKVLVQGSEAGAPTEIAGRMLRAELVKIALTVLLLAAALVGMPEINVFALLGGYALAHVSGIGTALTAGSGAPVPGSKPPGGRPTRTGISKKQDAEHG